MYQLIPREYNNFEQVGNFAGPVQLNDSTFVV